MAGTFIPIATTTLASATNTVTFSSIPNTYTDLFVTGRILTTGVGGTTQLRMSFNSASSSLHCQTYRSTNSGDSNALTNAINENSFFWYDHISDNYVTGLQCHIGNYASTSMFKPMVSSAWARNPSSGSTVGIFSFTGHTFRSTSAVTSIILATPSGNFNTNSTFSIYGIAKA